MTYLVPTSAPVSDTFAGHVKRRSKEPGTDYACAYGTPLVAPADGVISVVDNNPGGAEGRRLSIDLADGRRVSFIHLSRIYGKVGDRVYGGHFVCESGASGFGDDWYYDPHVHVSLWDRPGMAYADTTDFEPFTKPSGGNVSPAKQKDEDMDFFNLQGQGGSHRAGLFAVYRGNDNGRLYCRRLTVDVLSPGYATVPREALPALRATMDFIDL